MTAVGGARSGVWPDVPANSERRPPYPDRRTSPPLHRTPIVPARAAPMLPPSHNPRSWTMRLFLKIGFVAVMTIAILIALAMIQGVIHDRQMYRAQAVNDIARSYADAQSFAGPVLVVPYTEEVEVEEADQFNVMRKVRRTKTSQWVFFPTVLDVRGTLAPDTRKRGLHEVRVYEWKGKAAAGFHAVIPADGDATRQIGRPWLSYG